MELLKNKKQLTPSLLIPIPVRCFAKTLELISSRLASFFGIRLFITPVNFPIPKREQYMLKSAQKKRLQIPEIKKEIEILSYGYSKKKVLLVHGWSGRSTQLFAFADKLLENGFMVISFDGPAHGKSTGRTTMMPEFLKTIEKINTTFGPFEAAIGHSFGATSLYNAVATFLDIKTFIAIGSGDRISEIISNFAKNLYLKEKSAKKIQSGLEKKWVIHLDDFSSSTVAKKIKIPVLVVHDKTDGDVPVSCAYKIRQNLEKGSLFITNGLGHTKILRNNEVVHKSIKFIIQHT
ncbi:alpha/beta hydrolase [Flavobacteriaceae bacterium]|nr:alpha/beta hydrolase [Flavobacteriaceae bacterium]MDB9927360.1 alpha/beta hydrolase [Flavobacteriaceae bacterium]MDB9955926.1 alpha/beta hydrolase [Flavobacteriaceae bacterium]MDC1343811.1 alpha/beta hydrolase [Flavobacteriaceae bacterium]